MWMLEREAWTWVTWAVPTYALEVVECSSACCLLRGGADDHRRWLGGSGSLNRARGRAQGRSRDMAHSEQVNVYPRLSHCRVGSS